MLKQIDSKHMYSFRSGNVKFESVEEIPWTLDGEFGGEHDEVVIQNKKQGLRIMVAPKAIERLSVKGRIAGAIELKEEMEGLE